MLKMLLLVLFVGILVIGFSWVVISIYGNFFSGGDGSIDIPDEATHKAILEDAGEIIYIKQIEYKTDGGTIAHGYWEIVDSKYIYRDIDLFLDNKTVGIIRIEVIK